MNAINFIKEHGVEKAREVVEGAPECAFGYDYIDDGYFNGADIQDGYSIDQCEGCVCVDDLKRLVESVYLVKEHHTLDRAIEYANSQYTAPEIKVCLLDAIADYRSIYGGEHV